MKKRLKLILIFLAFYSYSFSQVGINTTSPQASLDVREVDPDNPTSSAGIAIPQVSVLPVTGNRAGQVVLLTSEAILYLFDGVSWKPLDTIQNVVPVWKSNTNGGSYNINDIINYDGSLYKNLTGINLDNNPSVDSVNWSAISNSSSVSDKKLGWAQYADTQYTSLSPLVILEGNDGILNINGGTTIKTELPTGITDFYDVTTSKIIPVKAGDGFAYTLNFKAKTDETFGVGTLSVDIGGTQGKIFQRVFTFPKGQNIEHPFLFSTVGYQLTTFKTNGGILKITANSGNIYIYDIVLQIHKTYDADTN